MGNRRVGAVEFGLILAGEGMRAYLQLVNPRVLLSHVCDHVRFFRFEKGDLMISHHCGELVNRVKTYISQHRPAPIAVLAR